MKVTSLRIENFRSIERLDVQLGETTVFIGSNNAGTTSILDAVRIALTRRWGQRGTGFTEYDIHLATQSADPNPVRFRSSFGLKRARRVADETRRGLRGRVELGKSGGGLG